MMKKGRATTCVIFINRVAYSNFFAGQYKCKTAKFTICRPLFMIILFCPELSFLGKIEKERFFSIRPQILTKEKSGWDSNF
jgi:hypothetical protein